MDWIKVTDNKPPYNQKVICVVLDQVYTGWIKHTDHKGDLWEIVLNNGGLAETRSVDVWMNFPELPLIAGIFERRELSNLIKAIVLKVKLR